MTTSITTPNLTSSPVIANITFLNVDGKGGVGMRTEVIKVHIKLEPCDVFSRDRGDCIL